MANNLGFQDVVALELAGDRLTFAIELVQEAGRPFSHATDGSKEEHLDAVDDAK